MITTSLDTEKNVLKTNKLAGITEMVISLDELDNNDNKRYKNWELNSLILKIMDQKGNTITNCLGMTIVLNPSIRPPKGFSSINFEQNNLETSNFA